MPLFGKFEKLDCLLNYNFIMDENKLKSILEKMFRSNVQSFE